MLPVAAVMRLLYCRVVVVAVVVVGVVVAACQSVLTGVQYRE